MNNCPRIDKWIKYGSLLLSLLMLLMLCCPIAAYAEENESKEVRIGWYQSDLFQEGMSDEAMKSGYSYEYIHKIAGYNGWKYEYVYGEWSDLFAKLLSGEIDLLAGVSKTEERMEKLLYPNEVMGYERYVLYQHGEKKAMDASDLSSFRGKKLGAISNNLMTSCLENWLQEKNAQAEIVYYPGFEERDRDFADGKLDGIVATDNNIMRASGYAQVAKVGEESYYLAVAKTRPDLLDDLNRAQGYIQEIDPYYMTNLEYQSYGTNLSNSTLSDPEEEWLNSHSVLTIGYLNNYLPYCGTDANGNAYGMITDVMDAIREELNITNRLTVAYCAYSDGSEMNEALKEGKIDAAFPVGGETWLLEQRGIKATHELVSSNVILVYRESYDAESVQNIAVTQGNVMMQDYLMNAYPAARFTEYPTINDCLDAVLAGKADATTINGLRVNIVNKDRRYDSLSLMNMSKTSGRCLGVAGGDTGLQMLLNRGIRLIGQDFAGNASYNYMADLYQVTITDFIASHLVLCGCVLASFILLIVFSLLVRQRRTKEFLKLEQARNEELAEKQALLEENSAEQEAHLEEIQALNAELQQLTDLAEAANRSKTNFLNNMSHDIRTPMNAILGFAELMGKKKDDPEAVSDYLSKIRSSGEYLLGIINNVLDMARIESGKTTVDLSMMDLLGEESKVLASISEMAAKKNQTFTMANTICHRYVLVDVAKQQEIMMNLLSNAIKYTPEGGSIQMNMDELPCDRPGYGTYRLTVTDNGIGMTKEFQQTIFDSFTRERNTTESKVYGTGLGMSIVKKLVDLMGGTIELQSEPGKGSTFTVTLEHPIVEDPEEYLARERRNTVNEETLQGKRILLAEDNDLNAEIAMEILSEYGLQVDRAEDGVECIDLLRKDQPGYYDLILMDIQMPNLDGYQTTRRIRAAGVNIPIVAMTANAFDEDKQKALEAGMNGHLSKPIIIPELLQVLSDLLSEPAEAGR